MKEICIWKPVAFAPAWLELNTKQIDQVLPAWFEKRASIKEDNEEMRTFFERLKRKQAIETGIVEGLYTLSRGATETFVMQGFAEDYLQHGDTNVSNEQLMGHLHDQYEALDWVFDFIKSNRPLSVAFIKELHSLVTRHQETATGFLNGQKVPIPLIHGAFKRWANNPRDKDGALVIYCPPEQVDSEMDAFISVYANEMKDAHVLIRAAWTHFTFVQIHPFQDGNGRIARLLTSLVLIQGGLFPFALERSQRPQYIDALEEADEGKYQPLVDILMDDQLNSMGPEVVAQALSERMQRSTAIYEFFYETVAQKAEIVLQQLKSIADIKTERYISVKEVFSIDINFSIGKYYAIDFSIDTERNYSIASYKLTNFNKTEMTDEISITSDMDEETWQFRIEDFIQKKLTCALRYITQSLL